MVISSVVANQTANLIRAALMIEGQGVCGIGVDSIHSVSELNVSAHELLARLVSVNILKVPSDLSCHKIVLDKGAVSLKNILSTVSNIELVDTDISNETIFVATGQVTFYLALGMYTISKPLTKDAIEDCIMSNAHSGIKAVTRSLPFISSEAISYSIEDRKDGFSVIEFKNIDDRVIKQTVNNILKSVDNNS